MCTASSSLFDLTLCTGFPHNEEAYISGENDGECVHTEDGVGVVMDTAKGELSFVVNGVNLGVAFDGIPLDKPLVPCVILHYQGIQWNWIHLRAE